MKHGQSLRVPPERGRSKSWSVVVLGALLVLPVSGCGEQVSLPEEIAGIYTTSDSRYAGRYLELSSTEVVFGLGDAGTSRHLIESVSREDDLGTTIYTLAYAGAGGNDQLSFHEVDGRRGSIVLRNQATTMWTKQGDAR